MGTVIQLKTKPRPRVHTELPSDPSSCSLAAHRMTRGSFVTAAPQWYCLVGCGCPIPGKQSLDKCAHLLQDVPSEWPGLISKVWTPASGKAEASTPQAASSLMHEDLCCWSQQNGAAILVSIFSPLVKYSIMCTCSRMQQFQDGSHLTIARCKPIALEGRSASADSLACAPQQIHTASGKNAVLVAGDMHFHRMLSCYLLNFIYSAKNKRGIKS